jgi:hypothetical protein
MFYLTIIILEILKLTDPSKAKQRISQKKL